MSTATLARRSHLLLLLNLAHQQTLLSRINGAEIDRTIAVASDASLVTARSRGGAGVNNRSWRARLREHSLWKGCAFQRGANRPAALTRDARLSLAVQRRRGALTVGKQRPARIPVGSGGAVMRTDTSTFTARRRVGRAPRRSEHVNDRRGLRAACLCKTAHADVQ